MSQEDKERVKNPYPFIKRTEVGDPSDEASFRCEHEEAKGLFKVKHLTVGDLSEIEALHSALVAGAFHQAADDLAKRQAWVHYGMEKKPEGFEVQKLRSEALLHALYLEVKTLHNFFREPILEIAVEEPTGDAS